MSLLQGVELYSTSIGPDNPNLQFDAQVTGTLQERFDKNYAKASTLYGSILNPPVTRADSAKAKEEYLKLVDRDLKKVGKVDWSISENVNSAAQIFQGIWSNKLLLHDAGWTKNYMDELDRAEGFRQCIDPAKCGGQYWDAGVKYMQYKREEFRNMDPASAMNFESVKYTPYNSVMDSAIKKLKESGLSIEFDHIENGYKITTKNGESLKSPLTMLFNETIGNDPRFVEMFKVKSYVDRKDWAMSKVSSGEYSNENEANLNYMNVVAQKNMAKLNSMMHDLNIDQGHLGQLIGALDEEFRSGSFQEGSETYNYLQQLVALKSNTDNGLAYISQLQQISSSGNTAALNAMVDAFDNTNAFNYFEDEIKTAVNVLAFKDYKVSMDPDEYAMADYNHKLKLSEMAQAHAYDVALENVEASNDLRLAKFNDELDADDPVNDATKAQQHANAVQAAQNFDYASKVLETYNKSFPGGAGTASLNDLNEVRNNPNHPNYSKYRKALKVANAEQLKLQSDANLRAVRNGEPVEYPEALTGINFASDEFIRQNSGDQNAFLNETIYEMSKRFEVPFDVDLVKKVYTKLNSNPNLTLGGIFYNIKNN